MTQSKNMLAQKQLEGMTQRRREILQAFADLGSKAEVGRMYSISRERVSQIIEKELGSRSPIVQNPTWFDWSLLRRMVKIYRLSTREIAQKASLSISSVSHTLIADDRYVRNDMHRKDAVGGRVLWAILQIVRQRMYHEERITRELITEFSRLKYGYSAD